MALPDINISALLVYVFGGGGIIGGAVAFLKFRREGEGVFVDVAKDTVEAQDLVLKNLQREVKRLIQVIEDRDAQIVSLTEELATAIKNAKGEVIAAIHERS